MGERQTEDLKVAGSIPAVGNTFLLLFFFSQSLHGASQCGRSPNHLPIESDSLAAHSAIRATKYERSPSLSVHLFIIFFFLFQKNYIQGKSKVLPGLEPGSKDSESLVMTITLQDRAFSRDLNVWAAFYRPCEHAKQKVIHSRFVRVILAQGPC